MSAKYKITLRHSRSNIKLCLSAIALTLFINLLLTVFTKPPHLAMYIAFFVLLILPLLLAAMWLGLYKVTVNGSSVTVRRATGLTYSFDISEVKSITRRRNSYVSKEFTASLDAANAGLQVIRVYTMSGKRFSVDVDGGF